MDKPEGCFRSRTAALACNAVISLSRKMHRMSASTFATALDLHCVISWGRGASALQCMQQPLTCWSLPSHTLLLPSTPVASHADACPGAGCIPLLWQHHQLQAATGQLLTIRGPRHSTGLLSVIYYNIWAHKCCSSPTHDTYVCTPSLTPVCIHK